MDFFALEVTSAVRNHPKFIGFVSDCYEGDMLRAKKPWRRMERLMDEYMAAMNTDDFDTQTFNEIVDAMAEFVSEVSSQPRVMIKSTIAFLGLAWEAA